MNNMNVSDKIKQLFYGLKMLDDEKIFPYSNFKNDEFFFITRDNKILSLLTAWIKHINEKEIVCISLYKEKGPSDKPPFIFVKPKGTPFKWLIEEKSAGVYYLTEKRFTEEDESSGYELIDTIYYPYEFEFFSSEYPQMALKSQANVHDEDKIQAVAESLALCEFIYVVMDPKNYDKWKATAKPYVDSKTETNCIFVALEEQDSSTKFYTSTYDDFTKPFYAGISMDSFEDLLSLSRMDPQLELCITFYNAKIKIYALNVYNAMQKTKTSIENFDPEKLVHIEEEVKKTARIRKTRTAEIIAASIALPFLFLFLYLNFRTPFASKDRFRSTFYRESYGQFDVYRGFKKDVVIDKKSRVKSKISKAPEIIGPKAFSGKNITSFTSTAFVKYIDKQAFSGCKNLKYVKLNPGVLEIQSGAFENCPIEEIEIPNTVYLLGDDILKGTNVKRIIVGKNAFLNNPGAFASQVNDYNVQFYYTDDAAAFDPLTYVTFSDDRKVVTDIFCPFETLVIPEGVECLNLDSNKNPDTLLTKDYIQRYKWSRRSCVKEMILPKSLKKIESLSFYLADIKKIELPENLEELGDHAFHASTLREISLNENLKKIGSSCFGFTQIENIVIPDSVTEIEDNAFTFCEKLNSIVLGDGIEKVDSYSFEFCKNLSEVKLGKNIKCISDSAFYNCKNLKHIEFNEGLEEIKSWAFAYTSLETVVIPKSVKKIGRNVFPDTVKKAYILNPDCIMEDSFKSTTKIIYIKDISEIEDDPDME